MNAFLVTEFSNTQFVSDTLNYNSEENIKAFKNRITTVWVMDMGNIDTETMEFWIENTFNKIE